METLVAPSLAQNKKEDDVKKQTEKMGGDDESSTVSTPENELELGPNFCLINQPDKDKVII